MNPMIRVLSLELLAAMCAVGSIAMINRLYSLYGMTWDVNPLDICAVVSCAGVLPLLACIFAMFAWHVASKIPD